MPYLSFGGESSLLYPMVVAECKFIILGIASQAERAKTTGDGWFGMKAPEITSELKNDLKVLKMRASLDPKHFYKKNDRDGLPKYFQVRKQQKVALYC